MREITEAPLDDMDDLELITNALNGRLDPARVEEVRRRLDEDPAFREFAAPMLLTWSVPKHLERHPRPQGELERHWDEFQRRTQAARQRRTIRRRHLWLLTFALIALGAAGSVLGRPVRDWYVTRRDFAAVAPAADWIPLGDSVFVRLAADARLRAERRPAGDARRLLLEGTATFRVLAIDSATVEPRRSGVVVETRGGIVTAGESEFTVATTAETTLVEVLRPARRRFLAFLPLPTGIAVRRDAAADPITLQELERARLVRGDTPERLPSTR